MLQYLTNPLASVQYVVAGCVLFFFFANGHFFLLLLRQKSPCRDLIPDCISRLRFLFLASTFSVGSVIFSRLPPLPKTSGPPFFFRNFSQSESFAPISFSLPPHPFVSSHVSPHPRLFVFIRFLSLAWLFPLPLAGYPFLIFPGECCLWTSFFFTRYFFLQRFALRFPIILAPGPRPTSILFVHLFF